MSLVNSEGHEMVANPAHQTVHFEDHNSDHYLTFFKDMLAFEVDSVLPTDAEGRCCFKITDCHKSNPLIMVIIAISTTSC